MQRKITSANIHTRCCQREVTANTKQNTEYSAEHLTCNIILFSLQLWYHGRERSAAQLHLHILRPGTNDEKISELLFDKKMQCGYKRCKTYLKYNLKQNERRNGKRGLIPYAARTAQYSPIQQPSVPGVSVCSSWTRYLLIRSHFR